MPRRTNRNHRNKLPIANRAGRQLQAGDGVGHRDMVVQCKKWLLFGTVPLSNTTSGFSFGFNDINIGVSAGIASVSYATLMSAAASTYEEYRIRRVTVRAQPGQGYTVDDRIKSSIFARVDVNSQATSGTIANLNTLIASECTVNRTLAERSNVKLVDYRPICYSNGGTGASSRPLLPSTMQWYNITERSSHLWRGATVAPIIADPSISPNTKSIVVWCDVEMEFRGRRPDFNSLAAASLYFPEAIDEETGENLPEHPVDVGKGLQGSSLN